MAGIIAKSAYRTIRFGVKYIVVPIIYTAFLGYLMQEAADRLRESDDKEIHEAAFDPTLRPAR